MRILPVFGAVSAEYQTLGLLPLQSQTAHYVKRMCSFRFEISFGVVSNVTSRDLGKEEGVVVQFELLSLHWIEKK